MGEQPYGLHDQPSDPDQVFRWTGAYLELRDHHTIRCPLPEFFFLLPSYFSLLTVYRSPVTAHRLRLVCWMKPDRLAAAGCEQHAQPSRGGHGPTCHRDRQRIVEPVGTRTIGIDL